MSPPIDDFAYTKQFFTITRQGHTRTTQTFGAPTLIWHVGVWPKRGHDPQDVQLSEPGKSASSHAEYNELLQKTVDHLNQFIESLQSKGRVAGCRDTFDARPPDDLPVELGTSGNPAQAAGPSFLHVCRKESINFTLWWADGGQAARAQDEYWRPRPEDLRVRVQVEIYPDFSTLTFFIDAGKPWNQPPVYSSAPPGGTRRLQIFNALTTVKQFCEPRIRSNVIDQDLLPEANVSATDAQSLRQASDLLYEGIWAEFCKDFDFHLGSLAGEHNKVFANLRGLVMSTYGCASDAPEPTLTAAAGLQACHRFQHEDLKHPHADRQNEPNAVVKGYWPFIRRSRSEADDRDWIACGVLSWRAIYVSALGAQSQYDALDEGDQGNDPSLPERLVRKDADGIPWPTAGQHDPAPTTPNKDRPAPFRYLLLTKFEPHRKQIGRMVDRLNALGTLQHYAFKNWSMLRDASTLVRMLGQELDTVLAQWIRRSHEVLQEFKNASTCEIDQQHIELKKLCAGQLDAALVQKVKDVQDQHAKLTAFPQQNAQTQFDRHVEYLEALRELDPDAHPHLANTCNELLARMRKLKSKKKDLEFSNATKETEARLIAISAGLDNLGQHAVGGIQYRINRSRYYADGYRKLIETLRCGNIETWWTYDQFANRGVEPAFRFIDGLGQRLEKLRERLRSTMEGVQTSAIVNQTEATRDNTFQLELIARELSSLTSETQGLRASTDRIQKLASWVAMVGVLFSIIIGVVVAWKDIHPYFPGLDAWLRQLFGFGAPPE